MTKDQYRHQRKALATGLLFFATVFVMMLPGRASRLEDVGLAFVAGCVLMTAYELAALLMNGPDEG